MFFNGFAKTINRTDFCFVVFTQIFPGFHTTLTLCRKGLTILNRFRRFTRMRPAIFLGRLICARNRCIVRESSLIS